MDFLHRLFFTKDDDMDLTQFYFGMAVVYFFVVFYLAGTGDLKVTIAAWSVFGSIFAMLAIAGTSHVVSSKLAESKVPGEVGAAIAKSGVEPNMWKDDERGDFKEREEP